MLNIKIIRWFSSRNKLQALFNDAVSKKDRTSAQNIELRKQLDLARERIRELQSYNDAAHSAEIELDFDRMNVFSIERLEKSGQSVTNVGYFNESTVREWTMYINDARHNELIEKFRDYKSSRNNGV